MAMCHKSWFQFHSQNGMNLLSAIWIMPFPAITWTMWPIFAHVLPPRKSQDHGFRKQVKLCLQNLLIWGKWWIFYMSMDFFISFYIILYLLIAFPKKKTSLGATKLRWPDANAVAIPPQWLQRADWWQRPDAPRTRPPWSRHSTAASWDRLLHLGKGGCERVKGWRKPNDAKCKPKKKHTWEGGTKASPESESFLFPQRNVVVVV